MVLVVRAQMPAPTLEDVNTNDLPQPQPLHRGDQGALQTISWQDQGPLVYQSLIHTRPVHDGERSDSKSGVKCFFYSPMKLSSNLNSPRQMCSSSISRSTKDLKKTQDGRSSSAGSPYTNIYQLLEY
eukprot:TRINITY_DN7434_c0_g1_i2.p1 TRINITY_DN7434_c0_g1~~TRINITY_DN7434_c0_g1_i2.p1  ORF type:complete len:127 (+),score=15.57 TRINITY_DN7434_c0_g1_i2:84-464(+)